MLIVTLIGCNLFRIIIVLLLLLPLLLLIITITIIIIIITLCISLSAFCYILFVIFSFVCKKLLKVNGCNLCGIDFRQTVPTALIV